MTNQRDAARTLPMWLYALLGFTGAALVIYGGLITDWALFATGMAWSVFAMVMLSTGWWDRG